MAGKDTELGRARVAIEADFTPLERALRDERRKVEAEAGAMASAFSKGFDKIRAPIQSAAARLADLRTRVESVRGALNTLGVIAGVRAFVNIISEAQRNSVILDATLRSTGNAAGFTRGELDDLSNSLSRMSGVDDDVITGAEAILLRFTSIGRETFPRALEAALDLSAAMGTDLTSAASLVGRALQDPEEGVTGLNRQFRFLSETEETAITKLVEVGDVAGAQAVILGKLEERVGGSADALRGTLPGAIGEAKNAFEELVEGLGDLGLTGLLDGVASAMRSLANEAKALARNVEFFANLTRKKLAEAELAGVETRLEQITAPGPLGIAARGLRAAGIPGRRARGAGVSVEGEIPFLMAERERLRQRVASMRLEPEGEEPPATRPTGGGGRRPPRTGEAEMVDGLLVSVAETEALGRLADTFRREGVNLGEEVGAAILRRTEGEVRLAAETEVAEFEKARGKAEREALEAIAERDKRERELSEAAFGERERLRNEEEQRAAERTRRIEEFRADFGTEADRRRLQAEDQLEAVRLRRLDIRSQREREAEELRAEFARRSAEFATRFEARTGLTTEDLSRQFGVSPGELRGEFADLAAEFENLRAISDKIDLTLVEDEDVTHAITRLEEIERTGIDTFGELDKAVQSWGDELADTLVDAAFTGEASFKQLADSILRDLLRIQVQRTITGPLVEAFSGPAVGQFFTSIFGAKHGAIFGDGARLMPFAEGGVISSPVVFPFANGVGIAGEAGPEAILPLERVGGDLGVRATGGGGVTVNIIDQRSAGPSPQVTQRQGPDGRTEIDVLLVDGVVRAMNQGRLDGAMAGNFGLRRAGTGR